MKYGSTGFSRAGRHSKINRSGLSILEVLGCIVAVVVGIWAGATYLGVDLLALVGIGMDDAAAAAGKAPDGTTSDADAATDAEATDSEAAGNAATQVSPGDATLAFWNRLREIIREEQSLRAEGERQVGGNALAVLHVHQEAYTIAAQSIRKLPRSSVDVEATQLAEEIAAWYDQGAELALEGTQLDTAELVQPQGPMGRRWHTAHKQHRAELDLLSRKCGTLRGKLTARYRLQFSELQ